MAPQMEHAVESLCIYPMQFIRFALMHVVDVSEVVITYNKGELQ
jgi:hypothetical protein